MEGERDDQSIIKKTFFNAKSLQAKYNKQYASEEEESCRRAIFEDNFHRINVHNEDFEAGTATYNLDANKFCDMTQDEFSTTQTGLRRDRRMADGHNTLNVFMPSPQLDAMMEEEVDWRKKGAVTPVKNQGNDADDAQKAPRLNRAMEQLKSL